MSERKKLALTIAVCVVAVIGFILAIVSFRNYTSISTNNKTKDSQIKEDDKLVSNKVPLLDDGTSSSSSSEDDNSTTYQNGLSKFDIEDSALNGKQLGVYTNTTALGEHPEYSDIAEKDKEITTKKKELLQKFELFKKYYASTDTSIMESEVVSEVMSAKSYIENEMMNFSYANEEYCGLAEALNSLLAEEEEIAEDSVYSCRRMQIEVSDNLAKLETELDSALAIYK